jgi:hypothetical protein
MGLIDRPVQSPRGVLRAIDPHDDAVIVDTTPPSAVDRSCLPAATLRDSSC